MELLLYKNFSKKKNSTKQPGTATATLSIATKQPTSLQNPRFIVSAPIEPGYNYAKWEGHYYFVDDCVLSINGMYEIVCTMDELASHKSEIGNYEAFIERAEGPSYTDNRIVNGALTFKQSHEQLASASTTLYSTASECYVVRVAGKSTDGQNDGGLQDYVMDPTALYFLVNGAMGDVSNILYQSIFHPLQYIASITWFPISLGSFVKGQTAVHPILGIWPALTPANAYTIKDVVTFEKTLNRPSRFYNDWRDYTSGWTTCVIRVLNQTIALDPIYLQNTIKAVCTIDSRTGSTIVKIYSVYVTEETMQEETSLIATVFGNAGSPEQITAGSLNVIGAATGAIQTAAMAASGNEVGAVTGAIGAVNNALNNSQSINGSVGCRMAAIECGVIEIHVQRRARTSDPIDYVGTPVMGIRKINNFSGFVKCFNASVDIDGFGTDKDTINNYLNTGFYYE